MKLATVAFCVLAVAAPAARAATEPHTLRAEPGVPVPLLVQSSLADDCSIHPAPETRIIIGPAHGELTMRQGRLRREGQSCAPAPGYVVLYRADPDFVGMDTVRVEVNEDGQVHTMDFSITIEGETEAAPLDAT